MRRVRGGPLGQPRTRPIVSLHTDQAEYPLRHCSPIEGVLCLLGRDGRQWQHQWTLRRLLDEQLADALNGTGEEDPRGEPAEYWWNILSVPDSYCLVASDWTIGEAKGGTMQMALHAQWAHGKPFVKAAVTEVLDEAGRPEAGGKMSTRVQKSSHGHPASKKISTRGDR